MHEVVKSKTIDVILPNLNKRDYIEECVESLLQQTYTDWRCLVIDGHSTDGSWEILQAYASRDSRFELHQPGRLGLYPSWNYGLEQVQSPLFTFLTSDDVWHPDWLRAAVKALTAYPEAACAMARPVYVDEATRVVETAELARLADRLVRPFASESTVAGYSVQRRDGFHHAAMVYGLGSVPVTMHAVVMRCSLAAGHFAGDLGSIADREWSLKMGMAGDVLYLRDIEAYLRQYDAQATAVTQHSKRDQLAESVRVILERNSDAVQKATGLSDAAFGAYRTTIQQLFDFLYARPSFSMARSNPAAALRRFLRAFYSAPRLMLLELYGMLVKGTKYTTQRRAEATRKILQSMSARSTQ